MKECNRECKNCEANIDHKRKDAVYCTVVCKKAYRHASNYKFSLFKQKNNDRSTAWRKANPEQTRVVVDTWHRDNPDRSATIKGKESAMRRGALVSDIYDISLCVPFYTESRRLTRETGVRHDVDHVLAISNGGLHCQTNLQVLTQSDNLAKRNSNNEP